MKIKLSDGTEFEVYEDETPEQAIVRYKAYKRYGVDPNAQENMKKRVGLAEEQAKSSWIADNAKLKAPLASLGEGLVNLPRNLANMVGLESDEKEMATRGRDAALTKMFPEANVAGKMASTLPLALGAQALPIAAANPYTTSAVLGGVTGAASGAPGDRALPAAVGAATSVATQFGLNKALQASSRGLAPMTQRAKEYVAALRSAGDKDTSKFLPVSMAASKEGEGSMVRSLYNNILPQMPGSARALQNQVDDAEMAAYRAIVNQGYGPKNTPTIMQQFAPQGGQSMARLDKALNAQLPGALPRHGGPTRNILESAVRRTGVQGTPSLSQIGDDAMSAPSTITTERVKDITYGAKNLLEQARPTSTVGDRSMLYNFLSPFGRAAGKAATLAGWGIPAGIANRMATKGFQSFLLGNTALQNQVSNYLAQGNNQAAAQLLIKAYSTYEGMESGKTPQEAYESLKDMGESAVGAAGTAAEYSVPGVAAKLLRGEM